MTTHYLGAFDQSEGVDGALGPRCRLILSRLGAAQDAAALEALADPRGLHRALYRGLTPEECPEIAGNFRGSDHPSLRDRVVFFSFNETEGTTDIARPHEVQRLMDRYGQLLRALDLRRLPTAEEQLARVAPLMIFFGLVHPFADGNGHIQRITVQFLVEKAGFKMTPAWRVHPCPYGEPMHRALASVDVSTVVAQLRRFVE